MQGVFVVQDFNFRWLASFSAASDQHTKDMALLFLVFPCGLIRGALANLGITAIVNADVTTLPGCTSLARSSSAHLAHLSAHIVHVCSLLGAQVYLTLSSRCEIAAAADDERPPSLSGSFSCVTLTRSSPSQRGCG